MPCKNRSDGPKQHAEAELWVFEAETLQGMRVMVGLVPSGNQHWITAVVKGIRSARNRTARHRGRYCMADGRKCIVQAEREKLTSHTNYCRLRVVRTSLPTQHNKKAFEAIFQLK